MRSRFADAVQWRIGRARKYLSQRLRPGSRSDTTAVFVVGCQRSGTNMFMNTVDRSPCTWIYNEGTNAAFADYRLRSSETIEGLIRRSAAPILVFKPLCDSHLTDRLLARHPGSKAIWVYRRYSDVVNSSVRMWGGNQRMMRWIAEGRWKELDWRGERLKPELVALVTRLHASGLSPAASTALFWYIRNDFYFGLGLDRDPRVLLVRYEDMVRDPEGGFRHSFEFLGCPFQSEFASEVFSSSVGREAPPELAPQIESLCEDVLRRLDQRYALRAPAG